GGDMRPLSLKATGGAPPFRWFVDGAPVAADGWRREARWRPDGAGFARATVVDATGAAASVKFRLR
ncbi:MAG: hypothetical protein KGI57_03500, partial [Hyphomicrobiales bacterium]|nr:hypothetical protein [Hyphomicrobiales bacterium]